MMIADPYGQAYVVRVAEDQGEDKVQSQATFYYHTK